MIQSCDWTHMLEEGGIGGVIVAIVWGLWTWWKTRGQPAKSSYEK